MFSYKSITNLLAQNYVKGNKETAMDNKCCKK